MPVCRPLVGLAVVLTALPGFELLNLLHPLTPAWALVARALLSTTGLVLIGLLAWRIRYRLLTPLAQLSAWAPDLLFGDLDRRLPQFPGGDMARLSQGLNALGDELQRLHETMDTEVCKHTETLAQKTRSLQVLYDVAASINIFNDLDDLLTRFLHTLIDVVNARAAAVRLVEGESGKLRLVAAVGLSPEELSQEEHASLDCYPVLDEHMATGVKTQGPAALGAHPRVVSVPLHYHGRTVGVYDLFMEGTEQLDRSDIRDLLTSVGRHLGMAIEKVRVDQQAQRLTIMQERSLLAHELHDSLAQTLASLRFQVRMLDDTLIQGDSGQARREIAKIRRGLEQANEELRGLLAHFRAPMDKRGLLPALEDMVGRFRAETGIVTFFQKECEPHNLPAGLEMQVLRILQEALTNIRKHSRAHAVRILLRCDRVGQYRLLVEDDGIGLPVDVVETAPGEHLGLKILRERAQRLGGELSIDSEPAEGTRIELTFSYPTT